VRRRIPLAVLGEEEFEAIGQGKKGGGGLNL